MQCRHLPDKDDPGEDEHGNYDPKTRIIRVLRRLEGWTKHQAMWHEWFHAITYDSGAYTRFTLDDLDHLADVTATAIVSQQRNALLTEPTKTVE